MSFVIEWSTYYVLAAQAAPAAFRIIAWARPSQPQGIALNLGRFAFVKSQAI